MFRGEANTVWFDVGVRRYHAVFELFSRLNHSCDPNILPRWDEESFSVEISTSKPVKAGDELFVTYIIPLQKRRERRAELLMKVRRRPRWFFRRP